MTIELDKSYSVKYIGTNEDLKKRSETILEIKVVKRKEYFPPKHFWSKAICKEVYDLMCTFRSERLETFPNCSEGLLSRYDDIGYFDTFEEAVKFINENFVERDTDFWSEVSLTATGDFFKPLFADRSGSFVLLEDTFTHNLYLAVRQNNRIISVTPYYDSNGKLIKANRLNPAKFSLSNLKKPYYIEL